MKRDIETEVVMDRFAGGLISYISDYFASKNGTIYRPKVNYVIPNEDLLRENWKSICEKILYLIPVYDYPEEIKEVAKQYLPVFLSEFPEYADEKCLQVCREK